MDAESAKLIGAGLATLGFIGPGVGIGGAGAGAGARAGAGAGAWRIRCVLGDLRPAGDAHRG